jgi:hypothetical protein
MLCLVVPFALYAGWTVCATFVNVAEVAPQYGFGRFGLAVADYGVLSIAVLTSIVAFGQWLIRGNLVFAGTVGWALIAIIVAAYERGQSLKVAIAAGIALTVVVAFTLAVRHGAGPTISEPRN